MVGGRIWLSTYGAQDIPLSGNPEMIWFKSVYKTAANFAAQDLEIAMKELPTRWDLYNEMRVSAQLINTGDLVNNMYLEVNLPVVTVSPSDLDWSGGNTTKYYWTYGIGNALIKSVELEIDGILVDRQSGEWLNIWAELNNRSGQRRTYDAMVGNLVNDDKTFDNDGASPSLIYQDQDGGLDATTPQILYVPLQFWFNKNVSQSLPLLSMSNSFIQINIVFRPLYQLLNTNSSASATASALGTGSSIDAAFNVRLWGNFIYLDTLERQYFRTNKLTYVIPVLLFQEAVSISENQEVAEIFLNFKQPVKQLVWVHRTLEHSQVSINTNRMMGYHGNQWLNFSGLNGSGGNSFRVATLVQDGNVRFEDRPVEYFLDYSPYRGSITSGRVAEYAIPNNVSTYSNDTVANSRMQYIYLYNFGVVGGGGDKSDDDDNVVGFCNFKAIHESRFKLKYASSHPSMSLMVYGLGYNIMVIEANKPTFLYSFIYRE